MDEKDHSRILSPYKKVLQWIEDTRTATNPHFEEVHNILYRAKKKFEQQRSRVAETGTEPSNKMGGHSKMWKLCLYLCCKTDNIIIVIAFSFIRLEPWVSGFALLALIALYLPIKTQMLDHHAQLLSNSHAHKKILTVK